MTKKICKNCQYFRQDCWCSNSKSPYNFKNVVPDNSCAQFSQRGKKAPLLIRLANKLMEIVLKGKR